MCELVELGRHMKVYERGLAKAQHEVTKEALKWSDWQASREHALLAEAQEQARHGAEMTGQLRAMYDMERAMKEHMQTQDLRYEEMEKQLGLIAIRVDIIERFLCNPLDGLLHQQADSASSRRSSRRAYTTQQSQK
jgi:hypothetical protein